MLLLLYLGKNRRRKAVQCCLLSVRLMVLFKVEDEDRVKL